jgi:hypothetical protein
MTAIIAVSALQFLSIHQVDASANASCSPDYTLTLSPTSATVAPGGSVRISATAASLCGLTNTVFTGVGSSSPALGDGLSLTHQTVYDLHVSPIASSTAVFTFTASSGAKAATYTITVTGRTVQGPEAGAHAILHSATFTITVS